MRKLLFACSLVLLALPAAALAGRHAPGDGTFSVKEGTGFVRVDIRGALIMRCSKCDVLLQDPVSGDGSGPVVYGEDPGSRQISETSTLYKNRDKSDLRIRIVGGFFRARITGSGLNVSAVGKGMVIVQADPTIENPGVFSIDDEGAEPLPLLRTKFQLGNSG